MMKTIFLLPPSEGKNIGGKALTESLSYNFKKPNTIAKNATEKDLKCTGSRYTEGIQLNKKCITKKSDDYTQAIKRYSGVMYKAIGYEDMFESGKKFFQEHVFILSGMYGILKPCDIIGNYKLPIETKGLLAFWGENITREIQNSDADYIVNLLPLSYQKMIDFSSLGADVIHVNFYLKQDGERKKMTHGVKKVKGEWLREICERGEKNYNNFGGIVSQKLDKTEVQMIK